ncbi:nitronate monooxygenase [Endozoicomonas sp. GU-1]|uniref:NAD(P)H-dependent flavin oxidoreductase n=1 Tax=Endozoicomonas sp. GU-1 TaxID=3009078 RepID=UPI0022B34843|nr:nitronate monooxygenase [Endozoicomonas sp. GU-1]WBA80306.1 nitronate monooxygenase [Endozoicomonas sp. GU-1]WBA87877.1 nitronate monooxygenase [Endozoicomonas sp. GU-1]
MHRSGHAKPTLPELFGTRHPIVAGGLMWLSDANYVAAAARAGVLGFITAASFPDDDELRRQIRTCREQADGNPFGVNVSMLPKLVPGEKTESVFKVIIEEGVKIVETSGRNPEAFIPLLHEAGVKVLHKVPSLRYALKAQAIGVDAVSIVGAECGGHPGMEMIGSFVNSAMALEKLDIPFLIGGGIGHGAQIAAALAMGAAGVVIGTRFLVAEEIWAHDGYKQRLIEASESDTTLIMSSIRNTVRALKNETTDIVQATESEVKDVTIQDLMPYISGKIGRDAYVSGDTRRGVLAAGQSLAFVNKSEPLGDIVESLNAEYIAACERIEHLPGLSSQ